MLSSSEVYPTIPVTDLNKAREFYEDKLGLKLLKESEAGDMFQVGSGMLFIYQRGPSKADHTLASFKVDDLEEEMGKLSQNGIKFEHYDLPNIKTDERGVSEEGSMKVAWFKDPDGNILGIGEMME